MTEAMEGRDMAVLAMMASHIGDERSVSCVCLPGGLVNARLYPPAAPSTFLQVRVPNPPPVVYRGRAQLNPDDFAFPPRQPERSFG